ncbi:hypothetical protein FRC11_009471 [Ceratobasidium sp. 423]|nr:hypothetical protein FRC11_009471 [Ceratobasidium sp. 423]
MPADTKHKCTESTHKCKGQENAEADKHKHEGKKVTTKAHKTHCEEAKEDNLLIKCEGESSEVSEFRVLTLWLESDNQCMCVQLIHHDKQCQTKPSRSIPELDKLGLIDVELIHTHMSCLSEEHDSKWYNIQNETCNCLKLGGLVWGLWWLKQDMDCCNTIVHVLEKCLQTTGLVFLLKECHNNIINYQHDQDGTSNAPDSPSSGHTLTSNTSSHDDLHADDSQTDEDTAHAHKAAACKLALQWAVEPKAHKLWAWAEAEAEAADQSQGTTVKHDMPSNDRETKIENLTEEVHKTIEHEEIEVPESSQAPLKAVLKHKHAHSDDNKLLAKKKVMLETKKTPTTTEGKWSLIIYMRHGHGGKVMTGHAQSGNAHSSCSATEDPEDDEVLNLSGQTGSSDDE